MPHKTDKNPSLAIFLDRDGTIIEDIGDLGNPEKIQFLPGAVSALSWLQTRFKLFIVTNQPAVAAGRLTMRQVEAVNNCLLEKLAEARIAIERIFVCPHARAQGCDCIKPKPHFLKIAQNDFGIDLSRSYSIGDHPHDAEYVKNAGGQGIYLLSGHGLKHLNELESAVWITPSLSEASKAIMGDFEHDHDNDRIYTAAKIVREGGVIGFPTETVYGLGANALDPKAAARIFQIKQRPAFDPLIVHIDDYSWIDALTNDLPQKAERLMRAFWPGPLTVVVPKSKIVPDLVSAGLDTVGIRMPAHETALALIRKSCVPICAPSANPFGYISPTTAEHVDAQLGGKIDMLLDAGPCSIGIESTIVGFSDTGATILRPGGVSTEAVSAVLDGQLSVYPHTHVIHAPGMLPRHYSPRKELRIFVGDIPKHPEAKTALILQKPRPFPKGYMTVEVLSQNGDLSEVAQNLFACLRKLDQADIRVLLVELAPQSGLGTAINDRLRRAGCKSVLFDTTAAHETENQDRNYQTN